MMKNRNDKLNSALSLLANKISFGNLLAETMPDEFINAVVDRINNLEGGLSLLLSSVMEAERQDKFTHEAHNWLRSFSTQIEKTLHSYKTESTMIFRDAEL